MWPGEVHSGYSTQWAFNPSAYQNLPNEQVDWATLAQQWIKMKETFPVDQVPPAPPPPSIKDDIEAGEAPMDMSKDDVVPQAPQDGSNWSSWNSWQQWGWNWSGDAEDKAPAAPPYTYPAASAPTPTTFDYNHGAPAPEQQEYWSGNQAPYVRNKGSDWRSEHRVSSSRRPAPKVVQEVEPDTTALFDAAKRKQLPAWIREGLEKMEREKQKKMERDRMLKEREEEMERRKEEEEEALALGIPIKSKFDTDSEESGKETPEEMQIKPRKSRFDTTSPVPTNAVTKPSPPEQLPVKSKSKEDILQEVMQQVRYVLTNLLMTVTNEEMENIAAEVYTDFRTKAPATQLRKTPAFTSLTGKLGLGIYDSDSEDVSSNSDGDPTYKQENGADSDKELRERIHRKKQDFALVERDIEHRVKMEEDREQQRNQESEEEPSEENDEKGQVEAKQSNVGVRTDVKVEEPSKLFIEMKKDDEKEDNSTPDRPHKTENESSEDITEVSDRSSSESTSRSSSSTRYKKSRKSSKRRKEKKNGRKKNKRSGSRGSSRRRSSHRKSSRRYEERHRYERSRSRSYSRGHYDEYSRKRRHSSESSHHRRSRRHSRSRSPVYPRGKKSSHRSRD